MTPAERDIFLAAAEAIHKANPRLPTTEVAARAMAQLVTEKQRRPGSVVPFTTTKYTPEQAKAAIPILKAKIARGAVPAYLRDRAQRPSPPIMFWVQEAGKWVSVELTAGEQRAIEAGQALPETMSLAEAKRRQAADVRTKEQRSADNTRLAQAWHARHPYEGDGYCACCDNLRSQPWYPDGPDAAA